MEASSVVFVLAGATGWVVLATLVVLAFWLLGIRYVSHNRVGIVEKLWAKEGSVRDGALIALSGEAGYQPDVLRGGLHFGLWPWQFRVVRASLTVVPQGRIGYVFARDGDALEPQQTLGRVVPCNHFQDARAFLLSSDPEASRGQRGRQRAILREGVYAINLALFVVITQDEVFSAGLEGRQEAAQMKRWQTELQRQGGFRPVVIARQEAAEDAEDKTPDDIGIVTVHDGPSIEPGTIIAPPVGFDVNAPDYHNHYQDPEAFLRGGGRRGRQLLPLTDGTYFINRWFATVELIPKTVVPIGMVGVVVSYHGTIGEDVSGAGFRHGELVGPGQRGVQAAALGPGKYAFNTYAGRLHLVPTTNFVLHWITGRTEESHRFDESLKSIDLVTADAYEPVLPLSVVVHIDYEKAASVVQRFGDVKMLITQTLDPLLSAYFRDIAHKKTMLELLHERDQIQNEARAELCRRFAGFDIELVDVLIGKPDLTESGGDIETLLDQLRKRQLAREQVRTYEQQRIAAEQLKTLRHAEAIAQKETELTDSKVNVEIQENIGDAQLAKARKEAEQQVVGAEAQRRSAALVGEGQGKRVALEGRAQAEVLARKVRSFGDARLFALSEMAGALSRSQQPLVPERLFVTGNGFGDGEGAGGLWQTLLALLVAERADLALPADPDAKASEDKDAA